MKLKAEFVTRKHSMQGLRNDPQKQIKLVFFFSVLCRESHIISVALNNIEIIRERKREKKETYARANASIKNICIEIISIVFPIH